MADYIPVISNPSSTQSGSPTWTEYTPAGSHTHSESDVTNLTTDLAGKASSSHTHAESDVTGLVSDLAGKAASSHTHNASDINAGTLGIARIPTGTSSTTVCVGDDSRLSDARTPLAHSITAAHNGFPGGTSTFLRADGTFTSPTASVTDPNPQSYTPGSFTVATSKYTIHCKRLQLTGSQRATAQGSARIRIT